MKVKGFKRKIKKTIRKYHTMTYNQFRNALKTWADKNDLEVEIEYSTHWSSVNVRKKDYSSDLKTYAQFSTMSPYVFWFNYQAYDNLTKEGSKELFEIVSRLAYTDPSDRHDEEYYLRHRFLGYENDNYLRLRHNSDKFFIGYEEETPDCQSKFTLKEIEEIKKKYDTDLEDFEIVEVIK